MDANSLIAIVEARGFKLKLKDGAPVISGDRTKLTPALMDALKVHRTKLIEWLKASEGNQASVEI